MFYWLLKKVLLGPLLLALFRPWVDGEENFPESGPAIFASNHLSFSDSFFLPVVCPRRITFPAKMEYFTGRGIKGRLTAAFFRGVGQIPIDRSGGDASMAALQTGLKVLRRGELFGIYPEGTRSPDGRLYKGKTGVARMALEAGVPVIPVAMIDTDKAQPTGKKIPRIMRVGVKVGKPLDFSRYEGMEEDRFVLRSITDEIMYELMLLSGQQYVDVYASSVKKNIGQLADDLLQQADDLLQQAKARAMNLPDQVRAAAAAAGVNIGSDRAPEEHSTGDSHGEPEGGSAGVGSEAAGQAMIEGAPTLSRARAEGEDEPPTAATGPHVTPTRSSAADTRQDAPRRAS